uniref:Ig-like domain-containing protein n=1 Tax=Astyanax mexicanus TaxID=7994 RepID=A0A8B9LLY4_ASTMX
MVLSGEGAVSLFNCLILSAFLPLRLYLISVSADTIYPDQSSISISEGSTITLSCTYAGSPPGLHWYQQKPGSRPEFLVLINEASGSNTTAQQPNPRLSIKLHKKEKKVDLEISSTAVSDSALYYCALQPTNIGE